MPALQRIDMTDIFENRHNYKWISFEWCQPMSDINFYFYISLSELYMAMNNIWLSLKCERNFLYITRI